MISLYNNWLLIDLPEKVMTTKEGLILTAEDESEIRKGRGTVAGKSADLVVDVAIGDLVLFDPYDAKEVQFEGKKQYLLKAEHLIGKIN